MAEGRSNAAIATTLVISEGAVEKHVTSIFTKLNLPVSQLDHRRVLAVLHSSTPERLAALGGLEAQDASRVIEFGARPNRLIKRPGEREAGRR